MIEEGGDYDTIQFDVRLPRKFVEEFKRFISRKWPVYTNGIIALEVQLAIKMWMENEGRTTHTQKYRSYRSRK